MVVRNSVVGNNDSWRHALPLCSIGWKIVPTTQIRTQNGKASVLFDWDVSSHRSAHHCYTFHWFIHWTILYLQIHAHEGLLELPTKRTTDVRRAGRGSWQDINDHCQRGKWMFSINCFSFEAFMVHTVFIADLSLSIADVLSSLFVGILGSGITAARHAAFKPRVKRGWGRRWWRWREVSLLIVKGWNDDNEITITWERRERETQKDLW